MYMIVCAIVCCIACLHVSIYMSEVLSSFNQSAVGIVYLQSCHKPRLHAALKPVPKPL